MSNITTNPEGYKAYSSFAPVYTDAVQFLYDTFGVVDGRKHEAVLRRISEHCNSVGCTFVGYRRLMELTHYSETTVKRSMQALGDVDYLRLHVTRIPSRRKPDIDMQVNPRVLWIQASSIQEAEMLWNDGLLYRNEIIHVQPAVESRVRTSSTNQNQNQRQNQLLLLQNKTQTEIPAQSTQPTGRQSSQREAQESNQREAQSQRPVAQQSNTPPIPRHPPSEIHIDFCRDPLGDQAAEAYALWLQSAFETRLQQARQVVMTYGVDAVKLVIRRYEIESQRKPFFSPFGIVLTWLRKGEVLKSDVEAFQFALQEHAQSLSGQYADLFER